MSTLLTTDVVIVGAGPVGLSLAMDLDARGIRCVVLERRATGELPSVKCNHVAARTMEQFRRLGVAPTVRGLGLPADYPHDIAFRTDVCGPELARVRIPARAQRFSDRSGPDGNWATPEPPHRINQIYLEPALQAHAATLANVTLMHEVEAGEFVQDAEGVTVPATRLGDGSTFDVRARFLVACDGGRSGVRKQLGIALEGTAVIQNVQSTCIRAPGLLERLPGTPAWCFYAVNPRRCGTVFAIDGLQTWLIHNHLAPHEGDGESVDRDASIRTILGVDADFSYEVVSREDWVGRRLVAPRLRAGNVFLCGDAAHLWVPYAGYGMNAGIADAMNLSWHLSAFLRGWADAGILDAYERERQPITDQVSRFAMDHAQKMIAARGAVPADIEATGAHGDAVRCEVGRKAYDLNVQQFCAAGLNFGYFYDTSPLITYDGEGAPAYTMGSFTPSTVPGCRAPHFWLADGSSLYDMLGPDYTLLRLDPKADIGPLLAAANDAGVPLTLLEATGNVPDAYRHGLVLCRADQHIAWRGNAAPPDVDALMARLRGIDANLDRI